MDQAIFTEGIKKDVKSEDVKEEEAPNQNIQKRTFTQKLSMSIKGITKRERSYQSDLNVLKEAENSSRTSSSSSFVHSDSSIEELSGEDEEANFYN